MALITETRTVKDFDEVSLRGYGDLEVEQAEGEQGSLTIEADELVMEKISTEVSGRRLILGFRMPWYEWMTWWFTWAFLPHKRVRYHLRTARVRGLSIAGSGSIRAGTLATDTCRLRISGSGRIAVEAVQADTVEASISGSGDIACGGSAASVRAEITGSGRIQAERLDARSVRAGISGSGGMSVAAAESLDVRITGSGSVRYRGAPRLSTLITGSGRLVHLEG